LLPSSEMDFHNYSLMEHERREYLEDLAAAQEREQAELIRFRLLTDDGDTDCLDREDLEHAIEEARRYGLDYTIEIL